MTTPTPAALAPAIYSLTIEHFRGIESLSWRPVRGANVILGGGDVGKTTILDAVGLLLSPTNSVSLSDTDYYDRDVKSGFGIEAIVSLPPASGIDHQTKASWPWLWSGDQAVVPSMEAEEATQGEPVYRFRVRGTEELDVVYEIIQPDNTADTLPVTLRRAIGLVRLSGDERNDRDLRLVQGSALDRLLSDKTLRARLSAELAKKDIRSELSDTAKQVLIDLDLAFRGEGLPDGLDLALTGSQGLSIAALIGLTARQRGIQLPLASWGAGTRRLAALAIAEQSQGDYPITIVDEVERGLEPYRQRRLMETLQESKSQAFITTHSPSAISAASKACLWYVDHASKIAVLDPAKTARHRRSDPEAFLARLTVVAEGATELGFISHLLEKAIGSPLTTYGIHVSDGGGHESTLELLEGLAAGGLRFGGVADNEEGKHPTRWQRIEEKLGRLLFRWQFGSVESNVIDTLPEEKLEALLIDPAGDKTGARLRTLAERLGVDDKRFQNVREKAGNGLKALILEAALGKVPDDKASEKKHYQAHSQQWFKSVSGGRELSVKAFDLGVWPVLQPRLMPFCNALRKVVGLPEIRDLAP
jgi:putative ATP-dependent endonuclease of OLD family